MAEFFTMPKLGMDMSEGTIVKWLKQPGDPVEKGEALAEIETDKSNVEVESPASGVVLKLYHQEGDCLPCGTALAAIGQSGEAPPELSGATARVDAPSPAAPSAPPLAVPQQAAAPSPAPATPGGRLRVSPRARRLAERNQVDLALLAGSGPGGRIVEQDVRTYLAGTAARTAAPLPGPRETVTLLTGVRKITAARMRQSLSEMAQTSHRVDVDMTRMMDLRQQLNEHLAPQGVKISFVDLLVAVCARALTEHPQANASLREDGLHTMHYVNIGIAADTPRGLLVPVIRDVQDLTLTQIAQQSRQLIQKAREGTLRPEEMQSGTFTISNLGMYEIDSFTAIVNPPETCILAVSRILDKVVPVDGQICVRPMMNLSLTYDHRVLDGAPAARFLQTIKGYIEHPARLLL